jgi:5,5'-dehydrodivanillate O-demethylase
MLTQEENNLLTRIGPGTKMGELLRRYRHPVAAMSEIENRWTLKIRVFGVDLVLFKDRKGKLGLVEESCPHRRASLAYGIPQEDGIRCPYHCWKFDGEGICLDQPFETERNALIGKKAIAAYPLQELGGLVFAYFGPQPAPLLPNFGAFIWRTRSRRRQSL